MKRFTTLFFLLTSQVLQAQSFEIKTRPTSFFWGMYSVSCEYMYSPKIGLELEAFIFDTNSDLNIKEGKGYGSNIMMRYYFGPRFENDGLSVAAYSSGGINDDSPFFIIGAMAGYKFINYKNFTISAELGLGSDLLLLRNDPNYTRNVLGKLSIGYYFERESD